MTAPDREAATHAATSPPALGRYELRWCSHAPRLAGLRPAGEGLLYEGPHGPAYADADRGRMRVSGPVSIECDQDLAEMRDALELGRLTLTTERRPLRMRCDEAMSWRRARLLRIMAGDRDLLLLGWQPRGIVMRRPDGRILGQLPTGVSGWGSLAAETVALEAALLLAFHASLLAGALAPLRSWRAWPAVARMGRAAA